jgi:hypothetical protein
MPNLIIIFSTLNGEETAAFFWFFVRKRTLTEETFAFEMLENKLVID